MMQFTENLQAVEPAEQERTQLELVEQKLAQVAVASHGTGLLIGPDGEGIEIPGSLFRILRQAVSLLSRGARVVVAPIEKEISTQEAADLLNVSRPYLVSLLEKGEIPCEKTGRYRKLRYGDVLAYREGRNAERRKILAEMMRKNRAAGIYDQPDTEIPETR